MKQEEKQKDKSVLSLFIVMGLSLALMLASGYSANPILRIGMQLVLFLIQFVVVKNILDEYYKNI